MGNIFSALARIDGKWIATALVILFLARLLWVLSRPFHTGRELRFNTLWAISTVGLTGLALELVLLLAYQNLFGYLYEKVGLAVALFMLGLAVGGALVTRQAEHLSASLVRFLLWLEIAVAGVAATLPIIVHLGALYLREYPVQLEALFMVLFILIGVVTGMAFPLVGGILVKEGEKVGKASGLVESADHLGACAGALVTGILLLPVLGIPWACVLIAGLNATSVGFLGLFLLRKSRHRGCR